MKQQQKTLAVGTYRTKQNTVFCSDFKKVLAMIKTADDVDLMKMHRILESEAKIRGRRKQQARISQKEIADEVVADYKRVREQNTVDFVLKLEEVI